MLRLRGFIELQNLPDCWQNLEASAAFNKWPPIGSQDGHLIAQRGDDNFSSGKTKPQQVVIQITEVSFVSKPPATSRIISSCQPSLNKWRQARLE